MIRRWFLPKWKREFHARVEALGPEFAAGVARFVASIEREEARRAGR